MAVADRYRQITSRIATACERSGRQRESVRLIAVTKYTTPEAIGELISLGHRDLGESRPQQLIERAEQFAAAGPIWHMIGTLQRNKVRKTLTVASYVHSVDTFRLLEAIDRTAGELAVRPFVLLEVKLSEEATKHGFSPEELRSGWSAMAALQSADLVGLMTMAPLTDDLTVIRSVFRQMRQLRDELAERGPFPLPELSMGMSSDFEIAIEEGATMVRVGSSLFDE